MDSLLYDFFKLAANKDRFRIMFLLFQSDLCVCQLTKILNLTQPTVSKNLSKLRDTRFVYTKRVGKFTYYIFKTDNICVKDFFNNLVQHLNDYPDLMIDQKGLIKKEKHLTCCDQKIKAE